MSSKSTTARIYERHIGSPRTDDEVRGYWMFVVGLVFGVLGIVLFLPSAPASVLREWSIVFGGLGLALLVAGPVIRLPLRSAATYATYLGVLVCLAAIAWFIVAFPSGWSVRTGNAGIITLYALGIAILGIGGVVIPLLSEATGAVDTRLAELEQRLEAERERREQAEAELAEAREAGEREAAAAGEERERLGAELAALRRSLARFELYEDASEQWRWRLRHRNGNVIAASGQGYTRKHNAQKGLHSVRSNSLGATILQVGDEADLPEAEEAFEPVEEVESRATFELFEDKAGEHRWRLVHDNGNVLADSGEGYTERDGVEDAVDAVTRVARRENSPFITVRPVLSPSRSDGRHTRRSATNDGRHASERTRRRDRTAAGRGVRRGRRRGPHGGPERARRQRRVDRRPRGHPGRRETARGGGRTGSHRVRRPPSRRP